MGENRKDSLGDRMKFYEKRYTPSLMPLIPVICRIDGRAFHTFTKGLPRPYDGRLSGLFIDTTRYLVQETDACCGYTQSDEISLVWYSDDHDSDIFFGGKLAKVVSVVCSMATAYFNSFLSKVIPERSGRMAIFDNRVFEVPSATEAANYFVWREQDATRNSVSMAAQARFGHDACFGKKSAEMQEMLWKSGMNWNDYPTFFKRGTYVRRRILERKFTSEELESLPPKHAARTNPDLTIRRTVVMQEEFPPITKITNRSGVLLLGEDPVIEANTGEHT